MRTNIYSWATFCVAIVLAFGIILSCSKEDPQPSENGTVKSTEAVLKASGFPAGTHAKLTTSNASWNASTATMTITQSVVFGGDNDIQGFYWQVPATITNVIIKAGVTVTGGFRSNHAITITGESRTSSVIFGTNTKSWKKGRINDEWNYTAISGAGIPAGSNFTIRSLTLQNSRTYNVNSYDSKMVVDNCDIINTRGANDEGSNNDGFGGAAGSVIKNSYLSVTDDGIKVYEKNMVVKNVTIKLQSKNSVAFQMGWDNSPDAAASATFTNVYVKGAAPNTGGSICGGGNFSGKPGYNLGVFAWKGGSQSATRTLSLNGFKVIGLNSAYMYANCWTPMPLASILRPNGKIILNGSNVFMSAAQGAYITGSGAGVNINICGLSSTTMTSSYSCGTDNITGDGIH